MSNPQAIAPSAFDRVMFALLLPGIALPAVAGTLQAFAGAQSDGFGFDGVAAAAGIVFMFVLLGSMTVNAWLILRQRDAAPGRTMHHSVAVLHSVLYGVLLVWMAGLFTLSGEGGAFVFVLLNATIIVLSILTWITVVKSGSGRGAGAWADEVPLSPGQRAALMGVLALAITTVGVAVLQVLPLGGHLPIVWNLVLMLAGLPWSHPLAVLAVLLNLFGTFGWIDFLPYALALGAAANVVLGLLLLLSPAWRTKAANWFYRRTAPAPAEVAGVGTAE